MDVVQQVDLEVRFEIKFEEREENVSRRIFKAEEELGGERIWLRNGKGLKRHKNTGRITGRR